MAGARTGLTPGSADRFNLSGSLAAIATMHGKEKVLAPLLRDGLGVACRVPDGLDTDRFGTFTRERAREGTALDAARAKATAALDLMPEARIAIASEGSFAPHPQFPLAPMGRELVLLIDRATGIEIAGHDATLDVRYAHAIARSVAEAETFAARIGFPEHALIVMGCNGEDPAPELALAKGITRHEALAQAVRHAIALNGAAFVETDMRAHLNPTRMAAIARAGRDLVRRYLSSCPACGQPGFAVMQRISGLPCSWCGTPTALALAEVLTCSACGHSEERPASGRTSADPGHCPNCNP
ncbi:MAG: DUF6671 family protein [Erythrobacter sp.]